MKISLCVFWTVGNAGWIGWVKPTIFNGSVQIHLQFPFGIHFCDGEEQERKDSFWDSKASFNRYLSRNHISIRFHYSCKRSDASADDVFPLSLFLFLLSAEF